MVVLILHFFDFRGLVFDSVGEFLNFVVGHFELLIDLGLVFLEGFAILFEVGQFGFELFDAQFGFVFLHIVFQPLKERDDVAGGARIVGEGDAVHVAGGDHEDNLGVLVFFLADGRGGEVGVVAGFAEGGAGLALIDVEAFLEGAFHEKFLLKLVGHRGSDDFRGGVVDVDGEARELVLAKHGDRFVYFLC